MAQTINQALANMAITHYDFDPDGTSATDVAWVDMRDFENFTCSFFRTVGTSDLTYKILANDESDGTGTDVVIATGSAAPDALGDYAFLECSAEQIVQEASDAGVDNVRYVSMNLTFATGTDEGVVTYVRTNPKRSYSGMTSDNIS